MQEIYDFLKKCGVFYLATVDGDHPRVRPMGAFNVFEEKLYIETGKGKNVATQMVINPKIEICAYDGKGEWIRIQAVAVQDERAEPKQSMLDAFPMLEDMYKGNFDVLYLKDVLATFFSFTDEPKTVKF